MKNLFVRVQQSLQEYNIIRALASSVAIGVLLYLSAMFYFGWQQSAATFADLGVKTLLMGALLSSVAYLLRFVRWNYAMTSLGHAIPRCDHLHIYLGGLALTATPGKSGETFRSVLLLRYNVSLPHSLAVFVTDRGTDVVGVCLLGVLAAVTLDHPFAWAWISAFVALLLGSCTFAHLIEQPWTKASWNRLRKVLTWLPVRGGQATLEAWAAVWSLSRVSVFAVIAMLAYGSQALVFYWFCQIVGTGIPMSSCVLIFVQATLFGAATMIPGGLGAMEAALVLQLTDHGVTNNQAVSLAIAIRLVTLWFGMMLGVVSLLFFTANRSPE